MFDQQRHLREIYNHAGLGEDSGVQVFVDYVSKVFVSLPFDDIEKCIRDNYEALCTSMTGSSPEDIRSQTFEKTFREMFEPIVVTFFEKMANVRISPEEVQREPRKERREHLERVIGEVRGNLRRHLRHLVESVLK